MRVVSKRHVGTRRVYDLSIDKHHNFVAEGVVVHNSGARKFCQEVKPTSIDDLAAITAIYRPGPLRANVHMKYVDAKRQAEQGDRRYAHPVIEEVLGATYGFVVMQEQFMSLAQKLGGFTPAESDALRKTLVKKSLDTIGKKADERTIAREKFVEGAKRLHGVPETVSTPLWQTIENMSTYCFNRSHSVSYAIDSYFAAWLYTYYPKHWLATILESETGSPDGLTKAISEIKQLGYKFSNADINYSGDRWYFNEEAQAFIPPLTSIKKVGDAALAEILVRRPFKSLRNLLWDDLGNWRFSKANKSVFENLCKIEAMGSLEEMRTGKIAHHRQLHAILIDHYNVLKKGPKGMSVAQAKRREKAGEAVPDILDVLLNRTYGLPDWSREEKILASADLASSVSNDLLFPDGLLERFWKKDIPPITELPGGMAGIVWMMVREVEQKTTKNGKTYLRIRAQDHQNKLVNVKVWGQPKFQIPKFSVWLCEAKGDDQWGPSTSVFKMRALDVE